MVSATCMYIYIYQYSSLRSKAKCVMLHMFSWSYGHSLAIMSVRVDPFWDKEPKCSVLLLPRTSLDEWRHPLPGRKAGLPFVQGVTAFWERPIVCYVLCNPAPCKSFKRQKGTPSECVFSLFSYTCIDSFCLAHLQWLCHNSATIDNFCLASLQWLYNPKKNEKTQLFATTPPRGVQSSCFCHRVENRTCRRAHFLFLMM